MTYFFAAPKGARYGRTWMVTDASAKMMSSREEAKQEVHASPGETIWEALSRTHATLVFEPYEIEPGHYYPRIARPNSDQSVGVTCHDRQEYRDAIATGKGQLLSLIDQLQKICRVVHPAASTLHTYGHEIRNLLILTCTEVEAHWKGVFAANGVKATSTRDYVKLTA